MCTVECPNYLTQRSINGSVARYCCHDPTPGGDCTLGGDDRNCVLGTYDPTNAQDPTVLPHARFAGQTIYTPANACPLNVLWQMTAFPVSLSGTSLSPTNAHNSLAQVQQACYNDAQSCYGVVALTDSVTQNVGVYFMSRPPQFPTLFLETFIDPTRQHTFDTELHYHLHRVGNLETLASASVVMNKPLDYSQISVNMFVLERDYGQDCTDDRLQATWYLNNNPDALERVQARVTTHLASMGATQAVLDFFVWSTNAAGILASTLAQDGVIVNGVVTFPFQAMLVIDLEKELAVDIGQYPSIARPAANPSAPLPAAVQMAIASGDNSTILASVKAVENIRHLHPNVPGVRQRVPIFGDVNGNFFQNLQMYNELQFPFVYAPPSLANNQLDVYLLSYLSVPDTIQPNGVRNPVQITLTSFFGLFMFYAARDWTLFGSLRTRGFSRDTPNAQCILNNPLWFESEKDPTTFLLCSVPRCPIPVDSFWNWGGGINYVGTGSSGSVASQFPNPPESDVQYTPNGIPCGGHGFCISQEFALASTGICACDTSFQVATGMLIVSLENGGRVIPRSLQTLACEVDYRGFCNEPGEGEALVCSNNGQCVVSFENNKQIAVCNCGSFPIDPVQQVPCNLAMPRSCENDQLIWQPNGQHTLCVLHNLLTLFFE